MAINSEAGDWAEAGSEDAGERAWLLQSPSVESVRPPLSDRERSGGVSATAAVFIVVNAALGAGLLNFSAAFNMAGGVIAGVVLQMVSATYSLLRPKPAHCGTPGAEVRNTAYIYRDVFGKTSCFCVL